ncbi:MAG: hypothetical protein H6807_17040 [Planctomycetes bacterium]|nr:hypothetical protein [Planctomycetota bacterium]
MQLAGVQSVANLSYLRFSTGRTGSSADPGPVRDLSLDRVALQDLFRDFDRLRGDLGRLDRTLGGLRRGHRGGGLATARSGLALDLDTTDQRATLTSSEEVNGSTTSFGPTQPSYEGSSTAGPTIGGLYDGSSGTSTLTFTATQGGIVGLATPIEFELRDGEGTLIDVLSFDPFAAAGTTVTASNGLELSLAAGTVFAGDRFSISVSNTTPQGLSTDAQLVDAGFEPGFVLEAGSFDLNGVTISVDPTDSLNDVIDRINSSAAGVSAVYDDQADVFRLSADEVGAQGQVAIENDSSGLIAALRLDPGQAVVGMDDQRRKALNQVTAFFGVNAGTFKVNGQLIAVDPAVDSLEDVLGRIESSASDLTASYDQASGRVAIESTTPGKTLALDDDTSGFLAAILVGEGRRETDPGVRHLRGLDSAEIGRGLARIGLRLDEIMGSRGVVNADLESGRFRTALITGLGQLFENEGITSRSWAGFETPSGIQFDLSRDATRSLGFDLDKFRLEARQNPDALLDLLVGRDAPEEGILGVLGKALDQVESGLADRYGEGGSLLDLLA